MTAISISFGPKKKKISFFFGQCTSASCVELILWSPVFFLGASFLPFNLPFYVVGRPFFWCWVGLGPSFHGFGLSSCGRGFCLHVTVRVLARRTPPTRATERCRIISAILCLAKLLPACPFFSPCSCPPKCRLLHVLAASSTSQTSALVNSGTPLCLMPCSSLSFPQRPTFLAAAV